MTVFKQSSTPCAAPEKAVLLSRINASIPAEAAAEGLKVHAAVAPYAPFVHQVKGRAIGLRKRRHVAPGKSQAAALPADIV